MCTCGKEYVDVVNLHNLLRIYHIHMLKIIPARCPSKKRALISPDSCWGTSVMCSLQGCALPRLLCARRPGDNGVSMPTNSGLSTREAAVSDSDVCAWTLGRGGFVYNLCALNGYMMLAASPMSRAPAKYIFMWALLIIHQRAD